MTAIELMKDTHYCFHQMKPRGQRTSQMSAAIYLSESSYLSSLINFSSEQDDAEKNDNSEKDDLEKDISCGL